MNVNNSPSDYKGNSKDGSDDGAGDVPGRIVRRGAPLGAKDLFPWPATCGITLQVSIGRR